MYDSDKDNRILEEYKVYLSPFIDDVVFVSVNDKVKITGTYRCTECNYKIVLTAETLCPRCSRCNNCQFYMYQSSYSKP